MALLNTLLALSVAFVLGTAIGFERQWRQRNAGLRTNVLVAVGAAAFSDLGLRLTGTEGAVRIVAYVVSGIGFLGAGVIMKDGFTIRGRRQHPRPQHRRDPLVFRRRRHLRRRWLAAGGNRRYRFRPGGQHAVAAAGQLG